MKKRILLGSGLASFLFCATADGSDLATLAKAFGTAATQTAPVKQASTQAPTSTASTENFFAKLAKGAETSSDDQSDDEKKRVEVLKEEIKALRKLIPTLTGKQRSAATARLRANQLELELEATQEEEEGKREAIDARIELLGIKQMLKQPIAADERKRLETRSKEIEEELAEGNKDGEGNGLEKEIQRIQTAVRRLTGEQPELVDILKRRLAELEAQRSMSAEDAELLETLQNLKRSTTQEHERLLLAEAEEMLTLGRLSRARPGKKEEKDPVLKIGGLALNTYVLGKLGQVVDNTGTDLAAYVNQLAQGGVLRLDDGIPGNHGIRAEYNTSDAELEILTGVDPNRAGDGTLRQLQDKLAAELVDERGDYDTSKLRARLTLSPRQDQRNTGIDANLPVMATGGLLALSGKGRGGNGVGG